MSTTAVNLLKVGVVVIIYLFLWFVARSVRAQVAAPSTQAAAARRPRRTAPVVAIIAPESIAGRTMEVRRALVVGRGEAADVVIDDGFASERHARFENVEGTLFVDDLGSTNGTFLNGERITGRTAVEKGDNVRVGGTIMEAR
ncbi:MAG: FHA domain-containing protein [Actinomycetota bacterium]